MLRRFPLPLQALYSELLASAVEAAGVGESGSFAAKEVKGRRYWYRRRRLGRTVQETYLGPETPELLERLAGERPRAGEAQAVARERAALVRQLRIGGYPAPDARTGRILQMLARAGLFRNGAVLVGTNAFRCYAAMLGVRLPEAAAITADLDLAQQSSTGDTRPEIVLERLLAAAEPFLPVPSLRDPTRTARWRTPDGAAAVELLTPLRGPDSEALVAVPGLGAWARPLRFLDYLIGEAEPALVLHRAGVPVMVPSPERYSLHKLVVAQRRTGAGREKAGKDLAQAAALIDILAEDRPELLAAAWNDLVERGGRWRSLAQTGAARLPEQTRKALQAALAP